MDMNKNYIFIEKGKTLDDILLDTLVTEGVISETQRKLVKAENFLTESAVGGRSIRWKGKTIPRTTVEAVWSQISLFPDLETIINALGFSFNDFTSKINATQAEMQDNARKQLRGLIKTYNREMLPSEGEYKLPNLQDRFKFYQSKEYDEYRNGEGNDQAATIDDINPGSRNRRDRVTRVTDNINSEELVRGEMYANFTRIPKTRWGGWIRFWDRIKSSVQQDKKLAGRTWGKTFVVGYQMERNAVYEIWYNSIDSTFSIHDQSGIEIFNKSATMSEAVRNLIRAVANFSSSDGDFLHSNHQRGREIMNSLTRAVTSRGLDEREKSLDRLERREDVVKRAQKIKAAAVKSQASSVRSGGSITKTEYVEDNRKKREETVTQADGDPLGDILNSRMSDEKKIREIVKASRRGDIEPEIAQQEANKLQLTINEKSLRASQDKLEKLRQKQEKEKDTAVDKAKVRQDAQNDRIKQYEDRLEMLKKQRDGTVTESLSEHGSFLTESEASVILENFEDFELQEFADQAFSDLESDISNRSVDAQIRNLRREASNSPYTQAALRNHIGDNLITSYSETRTDKHWRGFFSSHIVRKWLPMAWLFNRRSVGEIELPTDTPPVFKRSMMSITGQRHRADFIIGFSLANKVDVEIWYVIEPNPEYSFYNKGVQRTVASYYVYDINAGRILRRYIPYYRNALQVAMAKLNPNTAV